MNILMIAPECFLSPRGTPLSVLRRLRALSLRGHRVDLVTYPIGEDVELPGLAIHRVRPLPGLREIKVGPSWTKLALDALVLAKAASLLVRSRYDVVHAHEEAAFFAAPLARLLGVRHLYDMHSSLPEQLVNFRVSRWRPLLRLFRRLERLAVRLSDTVVVVYPDLVRHVQSIAPGKPVFLIENSDDTDSANVEEAAGQALRVKHNLGSRRVVLYTGGFQPYQGLDLLLASAAHVIQRTENVVFVCVGGTARERARLQKAVEAEDLGRHVVLAGMVPVQEVPRYLAMAEVLVSPRTAGTNTPLKIYSYLQAGKPIVATRLPTHTQVLAPGVAVLAEPRAEAFAEAILTLLGDDELRQRLAQSARQLAETRYAFSVFVDKTEAALASLKASA